MDETSVTRLLHLVRQGEDGAHEALVQRVHGELRRLAAGLLANGGRAPLQPTELVHEAYLRLVAAEDASFANRHQFYGLVACMMRSLLADLARRRRAQKRGGGHAQLDVELDALAARAERSGEGVELLDLAEAVEALTRVEPELARAAELRYVIGLPVQEVADVLGLPTRTAERRIAAATAWLRERLQDDGG